MCQGGHMRDHEKGREKEPKNEREEPLREQFFRG
jgi:hypothetical protein